MPAYSQIVPDHDYAHTKVVIHDNSARPSDTLVNVDTTYCNMMFVFSSPKGIDRELQTVKGYDEFVEKFGIGTFDVYGQAFLNAYAAASTNAATLHCLRVTADDASYAVGALVAHYKVIPGVAPNSNSDDEDITPSVLVNTNGHDDVIAVDDPDDFGNVTITVSGVDVTPGLSTDAKAVFGDVDGNYVDVTIDLSKLVELEDDKTYRVVQTNPCLALVAESDPSVELIGTDYVKTKTYSGATLKSGYMILLGENTRCAISVVEWGITPDDEISYVDNATDLGLAVADDKAAVKVSSFDDIDLGVTAYDLKCTGTAVASVINSELWGAISGNFIEMDLKFPGIDPAKTYLVTQRNSTLSKFAGDPDIEDFGDAWTKMKTYSGADLTDGYAVLVGEGNDAYVEVSEEESSAIVTAVTIDNDYTFVAAHPTTSEAGAIGDPTDLTVESAIAFVGNTSTSTRLRASAAYNRALRVAASTADPVDESGEMDVYYTFDSVEGVTDVANLGNLVDVRTSPDANGYSAVKIFELAALGRGAWGNNIRFVINNYARGDRLGEYKCYTMTIYEIKNATLVKKEEHQISLDVNAVTADGNAMFAEYVLGNPFHKSTYVQIKCNPLAQRELFAAYTTAVPTTNVTEERFDALTGFQYGSSNKKLPHFTIDTTSAQTISLSGASGIALDNGSDGSFDAGAPNRDLALNRSYLAGYSGEIDRNIRSRKLYPTDLILDANFDPETKIAIHELCVGRQDCMAMYDLGTKFNTYAGLLESLADIEPYITSRSETIEAYRGQIQDPVSFKVIDVTATYPMALMYPQHFQQNNGKHIPLAGSAYGILSGFLNGTAYPVFDDDLDEDILDELTELKVNFLKINSRRQVVRGAQTTRQDLDTNLSEQSNVFVLHDIRRDAVQLCEEYEYNFAEASELQRFNRDAAILASKYRERQVKAISAAFDMNDWESERGILHLYIDFVHKNIIKRSIVEISVNRGQYDV